MGDRFHERLNDIGRALFPEEWDTLARAVSWEEADVMALCNIRDDDSVEVWLPRDASDATVAHELGHAYACWKYPAESHRVDYYRHETVAFACEAWYELGREADREFIRTVLAGQPGFQPRA